jgi:hypothetical protein
MSNATSEEWAAAMAAWNALSESEQRIAVGWIASANPQLMLEAAGAGAAPEAPRA